MESNIYLEHSGVNLTLLDPSNQSFDPASDIMYSLNRSQFEKPEDMGNAFDPPFIRAMLFLLYTAVFILSFFGNLAVVLVTSLHWRMRKTATFCLFNLAIANLCVAIFCVYQNLSLFLIDSWIFGNFMCKMYFFIMSLSYTASILILVVIAIERYVVIMYPFEGRRLMTIGKLQIIIIVVWILSAVICFHRFYSVSTSENSLPDGGVEIICSPNVLLHNHKTVDLANFLLLFLLPLFIISVLYTRVGLYLKRHSLRFRTYNVTPSTITRSPTEMETLDRVLRDLTPLATRRRSSTKLTFVQVPAAQGNGGTLDPEVGGTGGSTSTHCSRCNSSKQGSPGSRNIQTRSLKRSQSWTESNERAYVSGSNGLPGTSWIHEVKSNGLLTSGVGLECKEGQQLCRGLNNSDLGLNHRESEECEFCGGDRISVEDRSNSSPDSSDRSQIDCRSNNVEMSSKRTLLQTREMENRVELIRLNFSRRRNPIRCRNNNSPGFLCFRRAQPLNQLRQPNANHKAVIRMLVVIVITFALCNFPFHMRKMCQNYFAPCSLDHPLFDLVTPATFLTMYANCAINPFIYALMHRRFRVCLMELLSRRCRRITRRH